MSCSKCHAPLVQGQCPVTEGRETRRIGSGDRTAPQALTRKMGRSPLVWVAGILVIGLVIWAGVMLLVPQGRSGPEPAADAVRGPQPPLDNALGMHFRWIPAGTFTMGSDQGTSDEKPVHPVTLSHGFYLQSMEVTQKQWQALMGSDPAQFRGDDRPVEKVSWNAVQTFIRKLNARDPGKHYRLPTEAEWEYAARAGTRTTYYWGDTMNGADCWYRGNSDQETHPVGEKEPNAWGLYDMAGNVAELCQDGMQGYPDHAVTDPVGEHDTDWRVFRGGSWYDDNRHCRPVARGTTMAGYGVYTIGFRLACSPPAH